MDCPHCLKVIHIQETIDARFGPGSGRVERLKANVDCSYHQKGPVDLWLITTICPACSEPIVSLSWGEQRVTVGSNPQPTRELNPSTERRVIIWPRRSGRPPVPAEVPGEFKRDYDEACRIIDDSPNASAALSRRCLQHILVQKLGAQGDRLHRQIQWTRSNCDLPSSVADLLDVPQRIGNRAAHPEVSDAGVIVDVEPWEAEWCLEVIEALHDHLFVLPARDRERLERLEQKAGLDAGQQPLV